MSEIDKKINDGLSDPDLGDLTNPLPDAQPEVQPDIEVSIELKKKAVNVQDLVFVRQYIDGKLEKDVPEITVKHAIEADHATNADNATNAGLAEASRNAEEATHAINADNAKEATHAANATNAEEATHAGSADTATYATNAGHAQTAGHAATADTSVSSYAETAGVAKKLEGFEFEVVEGSDDPVANGMIAINGHSKVMKSYWAEEATTAKNAREVNNMAFTVEDGLLKQGSYNAIIDEYSFSDVEVAKATNATLADTATNAEHSDDSTLANGHSIDVGEDGEFRVDEAPVHVATANRLYGYPILPKWEEFTYTSTGFDEDTTGPLLDYYVLQGIVDAHGDYVELKIGDRIQVVINPNSDEPRIFNGVVRKKNGVTVIAFPMQIEYYDYGESIHLSHMYFYNLEIYCAGVDKWSISYSKTTHSYGHPLSEAAEYVISDIDYTPLLQTITEVKIYRITI